MESAALAEFLRGRRAALSAPEYPGEVRRTPGLRREEVADRANISADYYRRLEQARGARPSPTVLHSLGRALELDAAAVHRMFRLAGHEPPAARVVPRTLRPHVADLLERISPTAAIVTAANYEVIGANKNARVVLPDLVIGTNLARRFFRDGLYWSTAGQEFAEVAVARLRASVTRYPDDDHLHSLISELRSTSAWFCDLWAREPTNLPRRRSKTILHPQLGPLPVTCDILLVPDDDQQVVFVTPEPDTSMPETLHGPDAHSYLLSTPSPR